MFVKSRQIIDPFFEQIEPFLVPVFHGLKGWNVAQGLLGKVLIIDLDVAFQVLHIDVHKARRIILEGLHRRLSPLFLRSQSLEVRSAMADKSILQVDDVRALLEDLETFPNFSPNTRAIAASGRSPP